MSQKKTSQNNFRKCSREKRRSSGDVFFFSLEGDKRKREKMRWEATRRWSALCVPLAGHLSSTLLNVLNWQARVNRQLSWPLGSKGRSSVERLLERLSLFFFSEKLPLASLSLGLHCKIKTYLITADYRPLMVTHEWTRFPSMSQEGGRDIQINK